MNTSSFAIEYNIKETIGLDKENINSIVTNDDVPMGERSQSYKHSVGQLHTLQGMYMCRQSINVLLRLTATHVH